jgi:hypothetical protein
MAFGENAIEAVIGRGLASDHTSALVAVGSAGLLTPDRLSQHCDCENPVGVIDPTWSGIASFFQVPDLPLIEGPNDCRDHQTHRFGSPERQQYNAGRSICPNVKVQCRTRDVN